MQPGELRQTDITQPSANSRSDAESIENLRNVHSDANLTESVQRAGDITQSTMASNDSGQVDIVESDELRQTDITQLSANSRSDAESTENLRNVHSDANSTESVQRAGDVTQSTTASNDSGQVDIVQPADLRQTDTTQPSANVLSETESTENLSNVQPGA